MKKMFGKKRHMKEDIDLQITAMASVFTVILVFLLKSSASDVSPLQAGGEMQLPELNKGQNLENSFKIEITESSVIFENDVVTQLNQFVIPETDIGVDGTITKLVDVIKNAQEFKSEKGDRPLVTVFADKRAPQASVERAIASAAKNGLTQIQLVVVNEEN